ncbi:phosphatase PAP2 family protein [Gordonia sp. CPCC 205515]|uniref:phosphatase PAP2 family protein n=1 Tax=Gordonia sp. CPCC 205515 TaxID=3140791 RepID=UPI003AF3F803
MTLTRRVAATLLLTIVCAVGIALAYNGGPIGIDRQIMSSILGHRNDALVPGVSAISDLFGPLMVTAWTAIIAIVFILRDRTIGRAAAVVAGVTAAAIVAEIVKLAVARPRPPLQYHLATTEMTYSYPSGHVTGTCALAVTTALVATVTASAAVRRWAVIAAVMVTVFAAATRLYLAVHWMSDVLAACAVGIAAALVIPGLVAAGLDELRQRRPELPAWCSARPLPTTTRKQTYVHR